MPRIAMRAAGALLLGLTLLLVAGRAKPKMDQPYYHFNRSLQAWVPVTWVQMDEIESPPPAAAADATTTAGTAPARKAPSESVRHFSFDTTPESKKVPALPHAWEAPAYGPYVLSVIDATSVFSVSNAARGTVFERYHNRLQWVYVRHWTADGITVRSIVTHHGRMYVVDSHGRLFERRRNSEDELEWFMETPRGRNITSPGMRSSLPETKTLFFISADGALLMRDVTQPHIVVPPPAPRSRESNVRWVFFEQEAYEFVALADAHVLRPSSIFVVASDGSLVQLLLDQTTTIDEVLHRRHTPPSLISPIEGLSFSATEEPSRPYASLFMRSEEGTLLELREDPDGEGSKGSWGSFRWVDHGTPAPGDTVAAPPGAGINGRSLFVVTSEGKLAELYWTGQSWIWVDHKQPNVPKRKENLRPSDPPSGKLRLASVRGTALNTQTLYFVVEDGRLAERKWNGEQWVWQVFEVPEGGSAPYCSGDRAAPDSCMPLLNWAENGVAGSDSSSA